MLMRWSERESDVKLAYNNSRLRYDNYMNIKQTHKNINTHMAIILLKCLLKWMNYYRISLTCTNPNILFYQEWKNIKSSEFIEINIWNEAMRGSWVLLDKKLPKDCSCEIITHHFRCLLFSCFLVSRLSTLQKVELHIHFAIDYWTIVFKIMKTNIMNLSLVKFRFT